MAILKDLIVNTVSRFIGKVFINESEINKINNVTVGSNPKFTDTTDLGSMTGTLPPGKGGTGLSKSTTTDLTISLINSLNTATGAPNDDTYYISQNTNAGYDTYYRRPASKIWEYIKGKISSWMKNNTAVGSLGWTSASNDTMPITSNTLAYWNGAYSGNNSNLSCLGTVTSGVWNGSTIRVGYGGTGATTLTSGALLQGNGANAVSTAAAKGSASLPIYIDSAGKPQPITNLIIDGQLEANSAVLGNVLTGQVNNFAVSNVTMNTFGRCTTPAATSTKEVTVTTPFSLVDGARITVLFDNKNTSLVPYLNVNNTGENSIWSNWEQVSSVNNNIDILSGVVQFIYITDRWHIIGGVGR